MRLGDLDYANKFWWKGDKYTQFMRPKNPPGRFSVICYKTNDPSGEYTDMPAGRKVKPVIRLKL